MAYTGSKSQTGALTVFSIGSSNISSGSGSATYTQINEILDFSQAGKTNKTADVTNLNSTGEEFLATLLSPGSYDLTFNRSSSDPGQTALLASFNNKTMLLYTITLPMSASQTTKGDVYGFSALVEEFDDVSSVSPVKQVVAKAKLKVSGSITLTVGT